MIVYTELILEEHPDKFKSIMPRFKKASEKSMLFTNERIRFQVI